MKKLRVRFERFCYKNRNKGIPNLMLYIVIGTGLVLFTALAGFPQVYELLCFDYEAVLRGQVWRLITFVFTMSSSNLFTSLIFLYCYYSLGRAVENYMGTFKFNLYYLSGVILMDLFAMVFGGFTLYAAEGQWVYVPGDFSMLFTGEMASFLHLSLVLCFSTLHPDAQFMLFFIIPIRAWILSLIYFVYTIYIIVVARSFFPQCLFPLVGLANYLLFFADQMGNLFPFLPKKKPKQTPFYADPPPRRKAESKPNYMHRCVVCGRTDGSDPELEFRYCSKCNGYFCYCQDHINNHSHIE